MGLSFGFGLSLFGFEIGFFETCAVKGILAPLPVVLAPCVLILFGYEVLFLFGSGFCLGPGFILFGD